MDRHGTKHVDIPKWSALLVEAVNKPGMIMEAYSAFHNYSIGNQILAIVQCQMRGLEPGPINTFPGWQALGRTVKRGERALILCMPITRKVRDDQENKSDASKGENGGHTFTSFMHKPRWFVISQTTGEEFTAPRLPDWEESARLLHWRLSRLLLSIQTAIVRDPPASDRSRSIPSLSFRNKALFHETAHVILGHTTLQMTTRYSHAMPQNLRNAVDALNKQPLPFRPRPSVFESAPKSRQVATRTEGA